MTTKREKYEYEPTKGVRVLLVNVPVSRCQACAEVEVSIPRIEALHRFIAWQMLKRPPRFSAEEVRYLRKYLGWSGLDFAAHMGVHNATVSRWENGKEQIGPLADRLLRLMVATREPVADYPVEALKSIRARTTKPKRLALRMRSEEWQAVAAGGR
jgi:putative zinc finger/helix-turn-helix YgiT family protein